MSVSPLERWIEDHPHLRQVAELSARVDRALSELPVPPVAVPAWDAYREDLEVGIPLLSSPGAGVDLEAAGPLVADLLRRLETDSSTTATPAGRT